MTVNAQEVETQVLAELAILLFVIGASSLSIDGTANYVSSGAESTAVVFAVSGLKGSWTATVIFSDVSDHQVVVDGDGDETFSANLSGLTNGTIASLLSTTGPSGVDANATGNAVLLDTGKN